MNDAEKTRIEARETQLREAAAAVFSDPAEAERWLSEQNELLKGTPIDLAAAESGFVRAIAQLRDMKRQNEEIGAIAGRLSKRFLENASDADRRLVAGSELTQMKDLAARYAD
ncbi:MAG: antitoxin Xre/MbcA/ParS toxin-binding domain-containing protein [Pseudomonadota bacterium]